MKRSAKLCLLALVLALVPSLEAGFQAAPGRRPRASRGTRQGPSKIRKKLETIVIPKIDLEQTTIPEVIQLLQRMSKRLDPEGQGVNILLFLKEDQRTEAAVVAPGDARMDWDRLLNDVDVEVITPPKKKGGRPKP